MCNSTDVALAEAGPKGCLILSERASHRERERQSALEKQKKEWMTVRSGDRAFGDNRDFLDGRVFLCGAERHIEIVKERFAHLLHITMSLAFDDLPTTREPLHMPNGETVGEYVQKVDYHRVVSAITRFRVVRDPTDITSFFALALVYLRQMKSAAQLPLLEQMISWFDAPNVVYCIVFLSHVWLFDDSVPLNKWQQLCEGVVRGVNLNKCVRNLLRILKYRLYPTQQQSRAALASLEYSGSDAERKKRSVHSAAVELSASAARERLVGREPVKTEGYAAIAARTERLRRPNRPASAFMATRDRAFQPRPRSRRERD